MNELLEWREVLGLEPLRCHVSTEALHLLDFFRPLEEGNPSSTGRIVHRHERIESEPMHHPTTADSRTNPPAEHRALRVLHPHARTAHRILFILALLLFLPGLTETADAACVRGPANCYDNTVTTSRRTCTASLACAPGTPGSHNWSLMVTVVNDVLLCEPANASLMAQSVTFGLRAVAATGAPTSNRMCRWEWILEVIGNYFSSDRVELTSSDGLPVELMEFSVVDDDESADTDDGDAAEEAEPDPDVDS